MYSISFELIMNTTWFSLVFNGGDCLCCHLISLHEPCMSLWLLSSLSHVVESRLNKDQIFRQTKTMCECINCLKIVHYCQIQQTYLLYVKPVPSPLQLHDTSIRHNQSWTNVILKISFLLHTQ